VPVVAANDAQAAAWGEFQATADRSDLVFLTVSTGLGGGIVADGRLLRGIAGHFGQMHDAAAVGGAAAGEPTLRAMDRGRGAAREAMSASRSMCFSAADAGEEWAVGIIDGVAQPFRAPLLRYSIGDRSRADRHRRGRRPRHGLRGQGEG
jgi:N-acetylmannosamine-6-phosphate 2-epimerase/N-acetylmannosamine kinase